MQINQLQSFGNVPVTTDILESLFTNLKSPQKKIQLLEKNGDIIRLKRNLYVVNEIITGKQVNIELCANHLYEPSYLSAAWALSRYGLIPERVYRITSMTTKHPRTFETPIGNFDFFHVGEAYFAMGLTSIHENGIAFMMASPEKALCDFILLDKYVPSQSVIGLERYLQNDIRFDMDALAHFSTNIVSECAKFNRKSKIMSNLVKIIQK